MALLGRSFYASCLTTPYMDFLSLPGLQVLTVPRKTVLLAPGEVAQHCYFILRVCLRLWVNHQGRDVTLQFFLEHEVVSSMESFLHGLPSLFTLEAVESCELAVLPRAAFDHLLATDAAFKDWFLQFTTRRFLHYTHQLLSFLHDTPAQRYQELVATAPALLQRVPLHYIASYLGITRVSLSRIRQRK